LSMFDLNRWGRVRVIWKPLKYVIPSFLVFLYLRKGLWSY